MSMNSTSLDQRRGAIYVVVLLTATIVATIAGASLQLMRLQGREAATSVDFIKARSNARAAIELGMLKIRNDPYWRTNLGNGTWINSQVIGSGTFSLSASDPLDNNVSLGENHPLMLTGVGTSGTANFRTSVRLEVGPRVGSCFEVSMLAGGDLDIDGAILTSDQVISSNTKVNASGGATVHANVEAFESIGGSTYTKSKQIVESARAMPDLNNVLSFYLAQGTTIPYTALPQWIESELITNPSFESGTENWYPSTNCTLATSTSQTIQGNQSLKVSHRATTQDVATHTISPSSLQNGNTFHLSIPIFPTAVSSALGLLTLTSSGDGVQTYTTSVSALEKDVNGFFKWVDLKADFTPTWTGTLTAATVSIWTDVKADFYLDKVSLTDITYERDSYVIDRQLLSPGVNPFGATNAQGIYVINCDGEDVNVGRSRIVGTLVFLNPGSASSILDSVCWEAAVYNYPALLSNDKLNIALNSAGVDEARLGINLNPPGTPYPYIGGVANTTNSDAFPSKITGLIYTADELNFSNSPTISGVVIAHAKINVDTSSLTIGYLSTYLNDPPPGFESATISMKAVPQSWQRYVD